MKRIILILLLAPCSLLLCQAQQGLHINDIFEGRLIDKEKMEESLVRGDNLAQYKLQVLHTVKFAANDKERAKADALFSMDMEGRISDDESNMEMESHNGHIYYAIIQLTDSQKGRHRYICYQCKEKASHYDITLVYMEGKATLADLRKSFKKK